MTSYYLFKILSRWVAERRSIFENFREAKSKNMLAMLENMSYCWLLMSIYIHYLMEIHRHMLVFIYSVSKNFTFLGLTSVDLYHPYTDLPRENSRYFSLQTMPLYLPSGNSGDWRDGKNKSRWAEHEVFDWLLSRSVR